MKKPRFIRRFLLFTLGLLLLATTFSAPAEARREAKMYVVTTWDSDCGGAARPDWDNMVDAWYDEITDSGYSVYGVCLWGHCDDYYSRDGSTVNGNIVNSKYADASVVSWGTDTSYLDEGDAVMVAWHGSESGDDYQGSMRVNEAGDGNCTLRRSEMAVGDSDLEFLHISSCQSMDDNQWSAWTGAFDGVHQIDGFHGLMWIGSSLTGLYEDFANDAFDDTIVDAWLDNMYYPNISNNDDQCPVALGVGTNEDNLWTRMGNERYNNVYSDPSSNGAFGVIYIEGCNPASETTIGSDTSS